MLADWDRFFPNCEPIGYRLRADFRERWVRFHSLPESKRYPESEDEYAEVLSRHNAILSELVQSQSQVVLVTTGYSASSEPLRYYPEIIAFDPNAISWRTIAMHHIENDFENPNFWHLFASYWNWEPSKLNPLIRLVADDVVANVLIVDPNCNWVLHPYDGGMDVITESVEARHRLRVKYSTWLSARADGL